MTIAYVGGANAHGTSDTADVTHGVSINSGDLVVIYISANNDTALGVPVAGTTFLELFDEDTAGASESHRQGMWWKIAGGSEPSNYTCDLNESRGHAIICNVFSSATDAEVDSAANTAYFGTDSAIGIVCQATRSQIVASGGVSIVAGAKDNAQASDSYTKADGGFGNVEGDQDDRVGAMCSQIFAGGKSFGSTEDVLISPTDDTDIDDTSISAHVSFVESVAGGGDFIQSIAGYGGIAGHGGTAGPFGGIAR